MRLIDKDALLKELSDLFEWCRDSRSAGLEQAMCMIHEQPTISLEEKQATSDITSNWNPVGDRLPNDGELVLLTFEGSEKVDMETAIYDVKYGFATTERYVELNEIIAWMPLPEPYKVGDNE